MSYYEYDPSDIAKSIQRAIDERADPDAVSYLLSKRINKINDDPQLAGYKDDAVEAEARRYIEKYSPVSGQDLDMLYEARRDLAAKNLAMAAQRNKDAFASAMSGAQSSYADARKGMYSAYQRSNLENEEVLAAQGLGRGAANGASSGFGETSRMMQTTAYQNNIANSYLSQNTTTGTLANQYMENQASAYKEYNEALEQSSRDILEQKKADREYNYKLDQGRIDEHRYYLDAAKKAETEEYDRALNRFKLTGYITDAEQAETLGLSLGATTADYEDMRFTQNLNLMKFDSSEEQRAFENSLAEQKFISSQQKDDFERAYDLFKGIGSVKTQQMADILGIPVGTAYWNYVVSKQNADTSYLKYTVSAQNAATSAARAAVSASNSDLKYKQYEVSKQNAETSAYRARTDRLKLMPPYGPIPIDK